MLSRVVHSCSATPAQWLAQDQVFIVFALGLNGMIPAARRWAGLCIKPWQLSKAYLPRAVLLGCRCASLCHSDGLTSHPVGCYAGAVSWVIALPWCCLAYSVERGQVCDCSLSRATCRTQPLQPHSGSAGNTFGQRQSAAECCNWSCLTRNTWCRTLSCAAASSSVPQAPLGPDLDALCRLQARVLPSWMPCSSSWRRSTAGCCAAVPQTWWR